VLFYINFLVNRTGKQEVFLGYSVCQFLEELGLDRQGYGYKRFYNHMSRLLSCGLTIGRKYTDMGVKTDYRYPYEGKGDNIEYQQFSSRVDRWEKTDMTEQGYYVRLSDDIYESIIENPFPIDMDIVKQLKGSTHHLDIYAFLSERLHKIPEGETENIEWKSIANLFGRGQGDKRRFYREKFKPNLEHVLKIYPNAHVEYEKKHLVLHGMQHEKILSRMFEPTNSLSSK